jgi:hypothetical protein
MAVLKQPTAHVRLTEREWTEVKEALQYAAAMRQAVSPALLNRFIGRKFEASPQILGQAADLIDLFVAVKAVPGPVTVFVEGPQGSGKTTVTAAIHHALSLVEVPTQLLGSDPIKGEPTVLLADVPYTAQRPKALTPGEIVQTIYKPVKQRIRERLGRWIARIRKAVSDDQ